MNSIGLSQEKSNQLAEQLNGLLANQQLYYQNLRGFHWLITGSDFFQLHVKFEEMYTEVQESIDMVAERIRTLEAHPLHTFSDYLANSEIKEAKEIASSTEMVEIVLDNLKTLIKLERNILESSDELNDEGTNSLMSDFISVQEKEVWMLKAFNK